MLTLQIHNVENRLRSEKLLSNDRREKVTEEVKSKESSKRKRSSDKLHKKTDIHVYNNGFKRRSRAIDQHIQRKY